MLSLDEIRTRLSDRNLSEVGRRIGLTGAYLSAIRAGQRLNPSHDTLKKISDYLEKK